ncbi:MAG: TMAO reductase system periplasmic protein TorT [Colwellia sp.]
MRIQVTIRLFIISLFISNFTLAHEQPNVQHALIQGPIKICAVYPHLKDSYWLSVNFGMTEQAKQRSISLKVLEAGGYQNTNEQLKQIEQCIAWQANAILVGSVNFDELDQKLTQVNKKLPVFALVNEISTDHITARTGVSWYNMGFSLGNFLANKHKGDTKPYKLAWFPGPKSGGGSSQSTKGLQDALLQSSIKIVTIKHGLNEKINQFSLLTDTLAQFNDLDYLAGNAVMAEMAINEVAHTPQNKRPKILSHYLSHAVYRGIKRHKILMANSDQMVLQGVMAIDQAINYLRTGKTEKLLSPKIIIFNQNNIMKQSPDSSLSPSYFKPIYNI